MSNRWAEHLWIVGVVAAVAALFVACAGKETDPIPANGRDVVFTNQVGIDDTGKLLVVRRGDTFTVALDVNGTAGYQWREDRVDEAGLRIASRRFQLHSDRVGSAGTALWEIQAIASGEWRIEMTLCRPWDCANSIAGRYALGVFVRPDADSR